ncbi:MAG: Rid family hydrolase [Desulfobacterales bacterium]
MEILKRENYPAAPFDAVVGCSPAVKIGNRIFIGGTSATNDQGDVEGGGDPFRQAQVIFKKINLLLKHNGASTRDVVRVRFYVTDIACSQDCLKAYSEWFKGIKPVVTLVEVKALARVDRLVEVEADAFIGAYRTSRLTERGLI